MRALVTAATGYVGSRSVPALPSAGHEVAGGTREVDRLRDEAWHTQIEPTTVDIEVAETTSRRCATPCSPSRPRTSCA